MIDFTALRKACDLATPGKWFARKRFLSLVADNSGPGATLPTNHLGVLREADDAAFAAIARTAVPELLDRVEALEAEVAVLRTLRDAALVWRSRTDNDVAEYDCKCEECDFLRAIDAALVTK